MNCSERGVNRNSVRDGAVKKEVYEQIGEE